MIYIRTSIKYQNIKLYNVTILLVEKKTVNNDVT